MKQCFFIKSMRPLVMVTTVMVIAGMALFASASANGEDAIAQAERGFASAAADGNAGGDNINSAENRGAAVALFFTLEECIERGLSVNPRVRAARSELNKAEANIGLRRGDYFPTFSAQSYLERINSLYASGPTNQDYLDQQITGVTLRLSQPLFTGLTIFNSHQKAILGKAQVEAWKKEQKNELVLEIQLHFLELLKARQDVESLEDSVRRLETGVEAAEAFHERRLAPYVQVLQAYVDLADARQQLSRARNRIETARIRLNVLLGFSAHDDIAYIGSLEKAAAPRLAFDECLEQALTGRPELAVARKGIEMARKDRHIARGQFSPEVNATLNYHIRDVDYDEPGTDFTGARTDRDQHNEYWTAGIRMSWEFGSGGQQFYQHRRTTHEIQRLRHNRSELKNQITGEVQTYFMDLREAEERIETALAALDQAREGYRMARQRFEVRVGTISELLDAQARLSRTEAWHNDAVADYLAAIARLYHAMGREGHWLSGDEIISDLLPEY